MKLRLRCYQATTLEAIFEEGCLILILTQITTFRYCLNYVTDLRYKTFALSASQNKTATAFHLCRCLLAINMLIMHDKQKKWSRSRVVRAAQLLRRQSVRGWASPCYNWKTLSVDPAVNGYLFRIRKG